MGAWGGREEGWLQTEQAHVSKGLREAVAGEQGFGRVELELDQPADVEVRIGTGLDEPRQADGGVGGLGAEVLDLEFEPPLEFVGGDRHSRVAADGQLDHGPKLARGRSLRQWVSACIPRAPALEAVCAGGWTPAAHLETIQPMAIDSPASSSSPEAFRMAPASSE